MAADGVEVIHVGRRSGMLWPAVATTPAAIGALRQPSFPRTRKETAATAAARGVPVSGIELLLSVVELHFLLTAVEVPSADRGATAVVRVVFARPGDRNDVVVECAGPLRAATLAYAALASRRRVLRVDAAMYGADFLSYRRGDNDGDGAEVDEEAPPRADAHKGHADELVWVCDAADAAARASWTPCFVSGLLRLAASVDKAAVVALVGPEFGSSQVKLVAVSRIA